MVGFQIPSLRHNISSLKVGIQLIQFSVGAQRLQPKLRVVENYVHEIFKIVKRRT